MIENIAVNVDYMILRKTYENWEVKPRTISNHELVFISEGEGYVVIEEKKYKCKKNDLIYFYPGLKHSLHVNKPPFMVFYGIHFNMDLEKLPIQDISTIENSFKLKECLKELYFTFTEKDYMFKWKINILMQKALFEVLTHIHTNVSPTNVNRINNVIEYIHKNPHISFTSEDLLKMSGMKKSYFIKNFKCITGKTPIRYTIDLRLEYARDLLLNSSLQVKKIALECGFDDEFYFSRVFKKRYGLSPNRWKSERTST